MDFCDSLRCPGIDRKYGQQPDQMSADAYEQGYDCMVYQDSRGRIHPLCGLYRPSLLPVIQQMLRYKDYKMMHLLIRSRCLIVSSAEMGDPRYMFCQ